MYDNKKYNGILCLLKGTFMATITSVFPLAGRMLKLELGSGETAVIDMKKKLDTIRFAALQDETLFMSARTDGNRVLWGGSGLPPCAVVSATAEELLRFLLHA